MSSAIPNAALDDRLGIVGTAGSGKTYGAGTGVERILARKGRCVIPDPLGVWWGLRLCADGSTPSPFEVVIFGGPHGDLPLNEHAGALIGETVASMKESAIIDLSELGTKASERRFMLAFLTALYRRANGAPVHLILDEADMWAPQTIRDKTEGHAAQLLGMTETIVRRGRIKGFIPWLITQRPAVVNKDVLSQVDGLVAFKLTSSHDRDALGAWVEGQADQGQWKAIYNALPTKARGEAVIWLPGHGVLDSRTFPEKTTFDSSRTPKRGEKRHHAELTPIDLGALKERLAKVETETKANDPKLLKAEIARLQAELRKAGSFPSIDASALAGATEAGRAHGYATGYAAGAAEEIRKLRNTADLTVRKAYSDLRLFLDALDKYEPPSPPIRPPAAQAKPAALTPQRASLQAPAPKSSTPTEGLTGPMQRILDAIDWWVAVGVPAPKRVQVAMVARYAPEGGAFLNPLGGLRSAGLIDYPEPGSVRLTDAGAAKARGPQSPPTTADLHDRVRAVINGPQWRILEPLLESYPNAMDRASLAQCAGYAPEGGAFLNPLGSLRTLGLITYPQPGFAAALPVLFVER